MIDANERKIRVGDLIFYGYGFCTPVVGIVTKITKNGFKFIYSRKSLFDDGRTILSSICKKPMYSIICNSLINNEQFKEFFHVNVLLESTLCPHINNGMLAPESDEYKGLEDI